MQKKETIAFDQYQRYETITELVKAYHDKVADNTKFRILELGANEHKDLKQFLPEAEIVFSDICLTAAMKNDKDFIQADATDLQFDDDSFDFVIAADVFEHIEPEKRVNFLKEAYRVARLGAILCFPFQTPETESAEQRVNTYYHAIAGEDYIWLAEHKKNGLPLLSDVEKILERLHLRYVNFFHGDIQTWEKMWYCHFNTAFAPETINFRQQLDYYYNTKLYRNDVGAHCYRAFLILEKQHDNVWDTVAKNMWGTPCESDVVFLDMLLQRHKDIHVLFENKRIGDELTQKNAQIKDMELAYALAQQQAQQEQQKLQAGLDTATVSLEKAQETNRSLEQKIVDLENEISASKENYRQVMASTLKEHEQEVESMAEKHRERVEAVSKELAHYQEHYHAAIAQREDLKRQLNAVQAAYNGISNAFFWKITKPARALLDLLKKPFRKSRIFRLIGKGLRCLKENGFRYTWRKMQDKLKHRQDYTRISEKPLFTEKELNEQRKHHFPKQIRFSIVVPLYNTPEKFLREMIQSVIDQTYADWELCMADGSDQAHSNVGRICYAYARKDHRIKYQKLEKNLGISGNTNACLDMVTGDYIGLFDHDDLLHPAALFEVARTICETDADFVYTDENTFHNTPEDAFCPHFKPDYAPDTLRANNYICHFTVFLKSLLHKTGWFRSQFDGSQDFDMVLRLTEQAKNIVHIPEILYYWRAHQNSVAQGIGAKPYVIQAAKDAIAEHLERVGLQGVVEDSVVPSMYRIRYEIEREELVSIVIGNCDHADDLRTCIESIFKLTSYKNYEIIVVENNSVQQETWTYYEELKKYPNVKIIIWEAPDGKFNYSAINNYGVRYAKGQYVLLLNNDVEVISADWIQEMLMFAQRRDVGAVGAMLYYPDDTIQHAGVIIGIGGVGGHAHKYFPRNSPGYMYRATIAQNYSAVTAACVLISKRVWDEVHGLDESFEVAFNDVDLCMRIRKAGYLIVWTPYAELYHYESKSRGSEDTPEKRSRFDGEVKRFQTRWAKELAAGDPYYNPNLTLDREDFSMR